MTRDSWVVNSADFLPPKLAQGNAGVPASAGRLMSSRLELMPSRLKALHQPLPMSRPLFITQCVRPEWQTTIPAWA